jgi:hypothetical protein
VLSDVIVQRQLALLNQQQDGHGGELFGYGSNVEHARRSDWRTVFQIGTAVTAFVNEFAFFDDSQRAPWRVWLVPSGKKLVNTL